MHTERITEGRKEGKKEGRKEGRKEREQVQKKSHFVQGIGAIMIEEEGRQAGRDGMSGCKPLIVSVTSQTNKQKTDRQTDRQTRKADRVTGQC